MMLMLFCRSNAVCDAMLNPEPGECLDTIASPSSRLTHDSLTRSSATENRVEVTTPGGVGFIALRDRG
jgi:hypothetical protein